MSTTFTRLLLVDDQPLFRSGLRAVLELHGQTVVGEANDGREAVEMAARIRPEVVLMDLRMPGMDGVTATAELARVYPAAKVVVLTTFADDELVSAALRAGAVGYLLKDANEDSLLAAIAAAAQGEAYLPSAIAAKVLTELRRSPPVEQPQAIESNLSNRELEILGLVARGANNKEIARALCIADGTVRNHVSAILHKLSARDRTQAAIKARELGLLG